MTVHPIELAVILSCGAGALQGQAAAAYCSKHAVQRFMHCALVQRVEAQRMFIDSCFIPSQRPFHVLT